MFYAGALMTLGDNAGGTPPVVDDYSRRRRSYVARVLPWVILLLGGLHGAV